VKAKDVLHDGGHRIEDHIGDVTDMIEIGKGGPRPSIGAALREAGARIRKDGYPAPRLIDRAESKKLKLKKR